MKHRIQIPANKQMEILGRTTAIRNQQEAGETMDYPTFVDTLFKDMDRPYASLHHAATGFAGESGEVLDLTKKSWVYDKDLDIEHLIEELGDHRYYYQQILNQLGITDEDVIAHNIVKLTKRFPGVVFTKEAAINRADKDHGQ